VLGALGMWICGAWVYMAGHTSTVTNIALVFAAAPVGIALGSAKVLGEHLVPTQKLGMALALTGVVFVIVRGDVGVLASLSFTVGDLWMVAAMLAWVAYSILLLHWRTQLSAVERLCCMAAGGLVVMLPFTVAEVAALEHALTWRAWGLIALAALLPGLIAYLAYGFVQRELGASRTALMLYLAPVYGSWLAWWLLDEPPRRPNGTSAALILPSIHLASRGARSKAG
jgi:drug/metabolite transporter (DMT)-like permease